jgi:hypothetical protein
MVTVETPYDINANKKSKYFSETSFSKGRIILSSTALALMTIN